MSISQSLQVGSATDSGRIRDHNEDCIATRPEIGFYMLADGMGGYNAGEVASRMATSLIADGLSRSLRNDGLDLLSRDEARTLAEKLLRSEIARANAAIFKASRDNVECAGMGTTIVACLFQADFVIVAHVGDSRLYRLRDERMKQLTRDHSVVQDQLDSGLISSEEARSSRNKNLLSRALGTAESVAPELHAYDVQRDDIYLLCCDGLSDMVADEEIRQTVLETNSDPVLAARKLVQSANDNGGRDNISVILIRVG